jgi:predicted RNase H-like HicB family nuclease
MSARYLIKIYWSDEDEVYVAEVPALPGCLSHGVTYEEAARNIRESMEAWIESAARHGDPVPEPDSLVSQSVPKKSVGC